MDIDWQKQLDKVTAEIASNQKATEDLRAKIKPIKEEINVAKAMGNLDEAKAKANALAAFDKTFNSLRSNYYFLSAEKQKAQIQLDAQK